MNKFLVYKTDAMHSYASRDLLAVCSSKAMVIEICFQQAAKEGCKIGKEQTWNLVNLKQTQGYSGEGEFHWESVPVDILI